MVQRLVQKEKQVLQLQAELDRFKSQNPNEGRDAVSDLFHNLRPELIMLQDERAKRDRDRVKWNTLMDEISKLKIKASHCVYLSASFISPYIGCPEWGT